MRKHTRTSKIGPGRLAIGAVVASGILDAAVAAWISLTGPTTGGRMLLVLLLVGLAVGAAMAAMALVTIREIAILVAEDREIVGSLHDRGDR